MKGVGKQAREEIVTHFMEYLRRERECQKRVEEKKALPDTNAMKEREYRNAVNHRIEATAQRQAIGDLMMMLGISHPAKPDVDEYIRSIEEGA